MGMEIFINLCYFTDEKVINLHGVPLRHLDFNDKQMAGIIARISKPTGNYMSNYIILIFKLKWNIESMRMQHEKLLSHPGLGWLNVFSAFPPPRWTLQWLASHVKTIWAGSYIFGTKEV